MGSSGSKKPKKDTNIMSKSRKNSVDQAARHITVGLHLDKRLMVAAGVVQGTWESG